MSCRGCQQKQQTLTGMIVPSPRQMVKGIKGIGNLFNSDQRVSEEVTKTRREFCRNCEFATKNQKLINHECKGLTNYSQCQKCACIISLKTLSKNETCPQNKW